MTGIVADNLSAELGTEAVYVLPRRRMPALAYRVEIDIRRFEVDGAGRVVLDARWRLYHGRGDQPDTVRRSQVAVAAAAGGGEATPPEGSLEYEPVVAAMSEAVAILSREIADAIARGA